MNVQIPPYTFVQIIRHLCITLRTQRTNTRIAVCRNPPIGVNKKIQKPCNFNAFSLPLDYY